MSFLIYSDGTNDLDKISKLLKLDKNKTLEIYKKLKNKKLITA